MNRILPVLLLAASVAQAQEDAEPRLQAGVAAGALRYTGGRAENSLGGIVRYVATDWLTLAATPTGVRVTEPATSTTPAMKRSGLTDLPLEATLSYALKGVPGGASLALGLGVTLPVGDTASGLGSGEMGSSVNLGLGFAPAEGVWAHVGAGRSLTGFSPQSAFSSGSGWGDVSVGYSLTEKFSLSGGVSTDLGAVDSTLGRSRSIDGGFEVALPAHATFNVGASRGLAGSAPSWSLVVGFGTAFPYLNHAGNRSVAGTLQQSFGGGTHGLGNGKTTGTGTTKTTGKGRARSG